MEPPIDNSGKIFLGSDLKIQGPMRHQGYEFAEARPLLATYLC